MHLAVYLFLNLASDSMVSLSQCSSKRVWAWNTPILSSHALFGRQYPRIERVREKAGEAGKDGKTMQGDASLFRGWIHMTLRCETSSHSAGSLLKYAGHLQISYFFPQTVPQRSPWREEGTEHNCKNCSCLLYLISLSLQVKSSSSFDNSLKSQLSWATWWGSVS